MFEYNTGQSKLILKEYGRNIQKLAEHIKTIDDRGKRTQFAYTLIELMGQLNPNPALKENGENLQKLWDDLFIMTDFTLDVDSPFPKPEPDVLFKKPQRLSYNDEPVVFKHYGKNIEKLIAKACAIEDPEERKGATVYLGRLMKNFYMSWNKENIDDEVIMRHISEMAGGKLNISMDEIKDNGLFDINFTNTSSYNNNLNNNKGRPNNNKGRRNTGLKRKKN